MTKPLRNPKHEKFAQLVAKGDLSYEDAYEQAGYKRSRKNAHRLKSNEDIMRRIEDIRLKVVAKVEEKTGIDKAWIMHQYRRVYERCMEKELILSDGQPVAYRFEPSGANKALEMMGRELGMFDKEKQEINRLYVIADRPMTPEEFDAKFIAPYRTIEHKEEET